MTEGFHDELWQVMKAAGASDDRHHGRGAFDFAFEAHAGQKRKWSGEPYIWHPVRVWILVHINHPEYHGPTIGNVALLHDTIEDCGVTKEDLDLAFDPVTAAWVTGLTDQPRSFGNRKARQAEKVERLSGLTRALQIVKYADWLDNWPSIRDNDPDFAELYRREVRECLEVMKASSPLRDRLEIELREGER